MNFSHLKLYHYPATRSARVRWALLETVGDNFELETVELYDGVQYQETYLSKNPNHNVPVLEYALEGGEKKIMLESVAIVQWLADGFPDKQLAPEPGLSSERCDYLQVMQFAGSWMDMMLWQVRIHEHVLTASQKDQRTIDRYRSKFELEVQPQLKSRLADGGYACGDQFSGADIIVGHNVLWALGYGLCQDQVFRDYLSRISKRPAFAAAFSDAHLLELDVPDKEKMKAGFSG